MSYTNADGLYVRTRTDEGTKVPYGVSAGSITRWFVLDIPDFTALATSVADADIKPDEAFIPANSIITDAILYISTAATSGGSATLTLGTYRENGTAIDADGIDATIALTAIDAAGDLVQCDGAQVGALVVTSTQYDAYVKAIYGTAAFTAGAGKLYIGYIET